jgi:adenine-specific DNA-methyltransferase
MNKDELRELLHQEYNIENWKKVTEFVFPNVQYLQKPQAIPHNNDKVESFKQIGNVKLNDGKNLAMFEVKVAEQVNLSRNRVELRKLVENLIDQERNHGVLVIYEQGKDDYRFTFTAKSTEFSEEVNDFVDLETDAKRYTYILGKNESCKTAANRFWELSTHRDKATIKDVENAFSVERLNKEFFNKYKEYYEDFVQYITGKRFVKEKGKWVEKKIGSAQPEYKTVFDNDDKLARNFVKLLLGRLVFIQFLQKKGWMGVPANSKHWKNGDPDFLMNLFNHAKSKNEFHSKCLYPLFYKAFNTPDRPNDVFTLTGNKVPYLNGGLFENENPKTKDIDFPATYFANLLEFFGQYNFTIDENDPLDHEIGIDPEMLGHIFENLLEDNKDKGAFYTPKPIVQYMCQESLIQYLKTYLQERQLWPIEEEATNQAEINLQNFVRKKIAGELLNDYDEHLARALKEVKICDPAIGSGAFPMGLLNEIFYCMQVLHNASPDSVGAVWEMEEWAPDVVKKNIIQHSIYGVDLEKGAVDIARLRFWLSLIVDEQEPTPLPNLDFKIMQGNSLLESYEGIDLSKIAKTKTAVTEVALDLFGDPVNAQTTIWDTKYIDNSNVSELINSYFNTQLPGEKQKLKKEIDNIIHKHIDFNLEFEEIKLVNLNSEIEKKLSLIKSSKKHDVAFQEKTKKAKDNLVKELANTKKAFDQLKSKRKDLHDLQKSSERPYFLWHLYFKDVFDNGGFDIVIGNPPYVGEKGNKYLFDKIKNSLFGQKYYYGKMDLFYFFFHLGLDLLSRNGLLAFITTNYFITATGASKLRNDLEERSTIIEMLNFNELKIFESALGQHNLITILKRGKLSIRAKTTVVNATGYLGSGILKEILLMRNDQANYYEIPQNQLFNAGNIVLTKGGIDAILDKVLSYSYSLDGICKVSAGIHPGMDRISEKILKKYPSLNFKFDEGVFILDNIESEKFKGKSYLKPLYKTQEINKYCLLDNRYSILYSSPHKIINDKTFIEHIERFKTPLIDIRKVNNENLNNWLYLRRGVLNEIVYTNIPKIITGYRVRGCSFAYTENDCYGSQDVYYITQPIEGYSLKFILGLLNSNLINKWLYYRGKRKGEMLELYQEPLSKIPIRKIETQEHKAIASEIHQLVDKILKLKIKPEINTSKYEKQIDLLVYKLYELTEEEIITMDKNNINI